MICTICKANEVGAKAAKLGTDFCEICFYTGRAAERDLADLLKKIVALDEVEDAAVWHTGGGCFNLAVTLKDGRLLTPSYGGQDESGVFAEPGLPAAGNADFRWGVYVSESREVWEEWDEERLFIPQTLWTTEELPEAIAKIARGEIVRPVEEEVA